ncbi:Crp/Fnr family transcriptional regulator [Micromonospora sp. DT233]|uniref:Crp/Fnr family transcriptional regulator n=1 Tax=Micromonospora sp. DT233 TaxID=3393432 RepID=UPI003CEA81B2
MSELFGQKLLEFVERRPSNVSKVTVEKGDNLYNYGNRAGNIYLLESGLMKTVIYARDGKKCLLSIFTPGDSLGELSMFLPFCTETASAMKRSVVWQIPSCRFLDALADDTLVEGLIFHLARRVAEQQQIIANLVTMDSERRLGVILLNLARKLGRANGHKLLIDDRITQDDLSGMVGTTRSRVGFFLKRFRAAGLVECAPQAFLVVHEPSLAAFVEASA